MTSLAANEKLAQRILRLSIAGVPLPEIAETLNVPQGTVNIVTKSPMFQSLLRKAKQDLKTALASSPQERIDALRDKAIDKLELRLDDEEGATQMRAIENVLDRGGIPRRTQVDTKTQVIIQLERHEREAIELAASEIGVDLLPKPQLPGVVHINDLLDELDDPQ